MTNLVILSDTHGLLRPEVKAELSAADCIIHAGDINTPAIAQTIRSYGKAYIVRGNNDKDWAEELPQSLTVTIEGVSFFIVHNKKDVPKDLTGVDVVIYGHSHKYAAEVINGVLWLNPGSCGKRRFDLDITLCRAFVDDTRFVYDKILIPHETTAKGT